MRRLRGHISREGQLGQGLVEFVFVVPLVLLFFCGALDLGILAMRTFAVSGAACDLCRAVQEDPSLLGDEAALEAYVASAYPVLAPEDTSASAETDASRYLGDPAFDPATGIRKQGYEHHMFYEAHEDDGVTTRIGELDPAYAGTVSTQPITARVEYEGEFLTPLGSILAAFGGAGLSDGYVISREYHGSIDRTMEEGDW